MRTISVFMALLLAVSCFGQMTLLHTAKLAQGALVTVSLPFADTIYVYSVSSSDLSLKAWLHFGDSAMEKAHYLDFRPDKHELSIESGFRPNPAHKPLVSSNPTSQIYRLYVPEGCRLTLKTIVGNIVVRGWKGPLQAESVSGFVDADWDNTPASLVLSSVTGELFSGLSLTYETQLMEMPVVGYPIKANIGGGGVLLELKSVSNHVYLRPR